MQNSTQINTQRAGIDKEILALRAKSIFFKVIKICSINISINCFYPSNSYYIFSIF